jgi:hypothetical protein
MTSLHFTYATAVKSGSFKSVSESGSESKSVECTLTLAEVFAVILYRIQKLLKKNERYFKVIWKEENEHDSDGQSYWAECEGGWGGLFPDLREAKNRWMIERKQKMFLDGIKIGGKVYYLDPVMYRQNWYDPSSIEVKLISEEQHATYIASGENLSNVHDKITAMCKEREEEKRYHRDYQIESKVRHMLTHVKVSGIADFKEALLVAETREYGFPQERCHEYNMIMETLPLLDAADRSVLGLAD